MPVNRGTNISVRLEVRLTETMTITDTINSTHIVEAPPRFNLEYTRGSGGARVVQGEGDTNLTKGDSKTEYS